MSLAASDSDGELPLDEPQQSSDISRVKLFGVPLASLRLHGEERLCLAQISATLLSRHTYNEIHNRRVALGITCVQCTPGQLDSLRRVGAMPAAAKRCGTITLREAERLVRSFHGESSRPSLPAGYSFEVSHACGWGCRGSFYPDRYTSSRARCVMCVDCRQFFSPNKFIFHGHQAEGGGGSFRQPDAANFNAWRRHLTLADPAPGSDVQHSWEDVKALYNGGSRMGGGGGGGDGDEGGRGCALESAKSHQSQKLRRPRTDSGDSSCSSCFSGATGGDGTIAGDGDLGRGSSGVTACDTGSGFAEPTATWPLMWAKCLLLSAACNPWDGGQSLPPLPAPSALWGVLPQELQALAIFLPPFPPQPELAASAATAAVAESATSSAASDGNCGSGCGLKRRRCDYSIEAIMSSNP